MSINLYIFLALAVGLVVGFVLSAIYYRGTAGKRLKDAEQKTSRLLQDARREAATIKKEGDLAAKDKIVQAKVEVEKELKEQRSELNRLDKRLRNREEMLDRKLEQFDKKEYSFNRREKEFLNREKKLAEKESNYEKLLKEQKELLERLSGLSSEDAKKQLLLIIEEESKFEAAKVAKRVEDEAVESANRKSKEIISLAIQRYASDYVSEHTISTVSLPSDEMKG
ncbi:MAG TPA: DUF3552 domain-containing protein, partial [Nitrospirae bacterium]|nr:DUF3552 domain-containing protein [Nitrospirota bacterium]